MMDRGTVRNMQTFIPKKIEKLVYIVGLIIRIYHDARSPERQICCKVVLLRCVYSHRRCRKSTSNILNTLRKLITDSCQQKGFLFSRTNTLQRQLVLKLSGYCQLKLEECVAWLLMSGYCRLKLEQCVALLPMAGYCQLKLEQCVALLLMSGYCQLKLEQCVALY